VPLGGRRGSGRLLLLLQLVLSLCLSLGLGLGLGRLVLCLRSLRTRLGLRRVGHDSLEVLARVC
jgi:hypothetical protein